MKRIIVLLFLTCLTFLACCNDFPIFSQEEGAVIHRGFTIPCIDLSDDIGRQVVVASGTPDVYQGHPTTVLLPDGKTIIAVWTYNHGGECGPMKKSLDGGKTWSDLMDVPDSWRQTRNCPTIYRLTDPKGKARLVVYAQPKSDPLKMVRMYSEDDGKTWTDFDPIPTMERVVMPWCTIIPIEGGKKLLASTNIRRSDDPDKRSNQVVSAVSEDGGLTWGPYKVICDMPGFKPCEPCFVRSPDGKRIACIMRENTRTMNCPLIVSEDEGKTWGPIKQMQGSVTGDRHQAVYAPDGRLVMVFRDTAVGSSTRDHFVGWVGTFDDLIHAREGQYRIKLLHSHAKGDCGYPGLELLPDGTFVATTYIKYRSGTDKHSVVSTRFQLSEIDRLYRATP